MHRKFTIFHLSLLPVQSATLFSEHISREDWLRKKLSEPIVFEHRAKTELHWVPHVLSENIVGVLQQSREHSLHLPPDQGGHETTSQEWQGAYLVVDPSYHDEGQRVAVGNDVVGRPSSLLKSLVRWLNSDPERPYNVYFEEVFNETDFWSFSSSHGNVLRYVRFEFVTPNMWDTRGELDQDLKNSREDAGAEVVKVSFWSAAGIRTLARRIREGVEYASRGGGTVQARSLDGKSFNSRETPLTSEVETGLIEGANTVQDLERQSNAILARNEGGRGVLG